jgi:hypothetical protein
MLTIRSSGLIGFTQLECDEVRLSRADPRFTSKTAAEQISHPRLHLETLGLAIREIKPPLQCGHDNGAGRVAAVVRRSDEAPSTIKRPSNGEMSARR